MMRELGQLQANRSARDAEFAISDLRMKKELGKRTQLGLVSEEAVGGAAVKSELVETKPIETDEPVGELKREIGETKPIWTEVLAANGIVSAVDYASLAAQCVARASRPRGDKSRRDRGRMPMPRIPFVSYSCDSWLNKPARQSARGAWIHIHGPEGGLFDK